MIIILAMLLNQSASATTANGSQPFCVMDTYGNINCIYATMTDCKTMLSAYPDDSTCVHK